MKNVFNPRQLEKNHNIALLFFFKEKSPNSNNKF